MLNIHSFIRRSSFNFFITGLLLLLSSSVPVREGLTDDILKYTNQFRRSEGKPALLMRNDLNAIARRHSEDMASGRCDFGHAGFDKRESEAEKLVSPFHGMAENVAYGPETGKEVVAMWQNSRGHRKNILGDYKYIGIGTATDRRGIIYYTQIFVH
ncbi:MAG TPA: CAP domain-containing protein [Chitinophagaceae bacterium]|nr:CAP domain-containing protein [Chitinophagaceae bacterium]